MSKSMIAERRTAVNFQREHGVPLRRRKRLKDEHFYYNDYYPGRVPRRSWKKRRTTKYKGV